MKIFIIFILSVSIMCLNIETTEAETVVDERVKRLGNGEGHCVLAKAGISSIKMRFLREGKFFFALSENGNEWWNFPGPAEDNFQTFKAIALVTEGAIAGENLRHRQIEAEFSLCQPVVKVSKPAAPKEVEEDEVRRNEGEAPFVKLQKSEKGDFFEVASVLDFMKTYQRKERQ